MLQLNNRGQTEVLPVSRTPLEELSSLRGVRKSGG